MERKTPFEHIVGGNEKSRKEGLDALQNVFDAGDEDARKIEREKSPEDIKLIGDVEKFADRMIEAWGGKPNNIPLDHIYFLDQGGTAKIYDDQFENGSANPMQLTVTVDRRDSAIVTAHTLAHELFHVKSYKSAQVKRDAPILYRSGLTMIDRHDTESDIGYEFQYFVNLHEAIVAESARILSRELSSNDTYSSEQLGTNAVIESAAAYFIECGADPDIAETLKREIIFIPGADDILKISEEMYQDASERNAHIAGWLHAKSDDVDSLERVDERKAMYELLDRIVILSGGKYQNRREIFDVFAKANYSGNYLPLARVVEGIFGEGSFRQLAEAFGKQAERQPETWTELIKRFISEE